MCHHVRHDAFTMPICLPVLWHTFVYLHSCSFFSPPAIVIFQASNFCPNASIAIHKEEKTYTWQKRPLFLLPCLKKESGQKERKVGGCWFSSSFPENILCSQRRRRKERGKKKERNEMEEKGKRDGTKFRQQTYDLRVS